LEEARVLIERWRQHYRPAIRVGLPRARRPFHSQTIDRIVMAARESLLAALRVAGDRRPAAMPRRAADTVDGNAYDYIARPGADAILNLIAGGINPSWTQV
jgi:hypothetical protein